MTDHSSENHGPEDWRGGLETDTRTSEDGDLKRHVVKVPALTILCHPDPGRVGEVALLPDLAMGRQMRLSRLEPVFTDPEGESEARPLAAGSVAAPYA